MNSDHSVFAMISLLGLLPASIDAARANDSLDVIWQAEAGSSVAFSNDSRLIVAGNTLRNAADGTVVTTYVVRPVGDGVKSVAISPDNGYAALGVQTFNQNLDVYDALTGAADLTRVSAHSNGTTSVAFSPDGRMLATAGHDGTSKLWSLPGVGLVHTFGGGTGYQPGVFAIAFSPNGRSLAVGGDGGVSIFSVADGSLMQTLTDEATLSLAYSPDGLILATGSNVTDLQGQCVECSINLWQPADGSLLRSIDGNGNGVTALAFSPDRTIVAAGSGAGTYDGVVRLLRSDDGTEAGSFAQAGAYVTNVAYSPDGNLFAFARSDAHVVVAHNPDPDATNGCDYLLAPASATFAAGGGSGKIGVSTESACTWHAISNANWVHIAAASDDGSGTIAYSVEPNAGAMRRTLIVVEGRTLTLEQNGSGGSSRNK